MIRNVGILLAVWLLASVTLPAAAETAAAATGDATLSASTNVAKTLDGERWFFEPLIGFSFGGSGFLAGHAVNTSTGEKKDVRLNPAHSIAFGAQTHYRAFENLLLAGSLSYNLANDSENVDGASAKFTWINTGLSVLAQADIYFAGVGVDYYGAPEMKITGWTDLKAQYKSAFGQHVIIGVRGMDRKRRNSYGAQLRYRVATLEASKMTLNGVDTYDVIAPDGTHLRTVKMNAAEIALAVGFYF